MEAAATDGFMEDARQSLISNEFGTPRSRSPTTIEHERQISPPLYQPEHRHAPRTALTEYGTYTLDLMGDVVHSRLLTGLLLGGITPVAVLVNQVIKTQLWENVPLKVNPPSLKSYAWWMLTVLLTAAAVLPAGIGNSLNSRMNHKRFSFCWSVVLCLSAVVGGLAVDNADPDFFSAEAWGFAALTLFIYSGCAIMNLLLMLEKKVPMLRGYTLNERIEARNEIVEARHEAACAQAQGQETLETLFKLLGANEFEATLLPILDAHWKEKAEPMLVQLKRTAEITKLSTFANERSPPNSGPTSEGSEPMSPHHQPSSEEECDSPKSMPPTPPGTPKSIGGRMLRGWSVVRLATQGMLSNRVNSYREEVDFLVNDDVDAASITPEPATAIPTKKRARFFFPWVTLMIVVVMVVVLTGFVIDFTAVLAGIKDNLGKYVYDWELLTEAFELVSPCSLVYNDWYFATLAANASNTSAARTSALVAASEAGLASVGISYCPYTLPPASVYIEKQVKIMNKISDNVDDLKTALEIAMIVAVCLTLPYVLRCVHKSFLAFKLVSLEVRVDGGFKRHLGRYGIDDPDQCKKIEQEHFKVSAASEYAGQVLLCAIVGGIWMIVLLSIPILCFAWEPIRTAIFNAWSLILWLVAAIVFDKFVMRELVMNKLLSDGTYVRKECRLLFAIIFPIAQIWYVFIGICFVLGRFIETLIIHIGSLIRTDTTLYRKDRTKAKHDGSFSNDRAFGSFCGAIRFYQYNLLNFGEACDLGANCDYPDPNGDASPERVTSADDFQLTLGRPNRRTAVAEELRGTI